MASKLRRLTRGDLVAAAGAYASALVRWDDAIEDIGSRIAFDRMDRDPKVRQLKFDCEDALRHYNTLVRRYLEAEHKDETDERYYQAEVRRLEEEARLAAEEAAALEEEKPSPRKKGRAAS